VPRTHSEKRILSSIYGVRKTEYTHTEKCSFLKLHNKSNTQEVKDLNVREDYKSAGAKIGKMLLLHV
jgi:hypothetical protein